MLVHVVRHGETDWNSAGLAQGQSDLPRLNEQGRHEAAHAAAQLAGVGATALFSSDLRRARETAEVIAAATGLPVQLTPALREQALGEWEGRVSAELWTSPECAGEWTADRAAPGGESARAVHERLSAFFRDVLATAHGPIVVVTHGDAARVALGLLAGHGADDLPWAHLATGQVLTVAADRALPLPEGSLR